MPTEANKRSVETVFKAVICQRVDEAQASITAQEVEEALINTFSGHYLVAIDVERKGCRDV